MESAAAVRQSNLKDCMLKVHLKITKLLPCFLKCSRQPQGYMKGLLRFHMNKLSNDKLIAVLLYPYGQPYIVTLPFLKVTWYFCMEIKLSVPRHIDEYRNFNTINVFNQLVHLPFWNVTSGYCWKNLFCCLEWIKERVFLRKWFLSSSISFNMHIAFIHYWPFIPYPLHPNTAPYLLHILNPWPPRGSLPSTACFSTLTPHPVTLLQIGAGYFQAKPFPV